MVQNGAVPPLSPSSPRWTVEEGLLAGTVRLTLNSLMMMWHTVGSMEDEVFL